MTEDKTVTSTAQKMMEVIHMGKELNKESKRQHTLEERLNIKHTELRDRLEKIKKLNDRIETTLNNIPKHSSIENEDEEFI